MKIDLNGKWSLSSATYSNLEATIPGSVLSTLLEKIPQLPPEKRNGIIAPTSAKEMQISNWCNVKKVGLPKETGNYIVSMTHYGHNKLKQGEPIEKVEIRHFYASEGGLNANVCEYKNSPFENFDIHAYMPFPEFYRERDGIALEEDKDDLEM